MRISKVAVVAATSIMLSGTVHADQAGDPKALAKAQFMLRQMSGELDAARAENNLLKTDLESLKARKSSTDGALAKSREQLQDLQGRLDQTLAEKQKADETLAERGHQLERCSVKNAKLYDLNTDLLKRYADKGMVDVLTRREPLTGFKKIEMENLVQDLQDKLDEQRYLAGQTARLADDASLVTR